MSAACENCKHYHAGTMTCRRFPPVVSVIMVPRPVSMRGALQGQQQMAMEPTPVAAFPPVGDPADSLCGEWVPQLGVQ